MPRESLLLRSVLTLLGLFLFYEGLILLEDLLIPMAFAGIVACILLPSVRQLEHRGWNRMWAAAICVLMFLTAAAGVVIILVDQAAMFGDDFPILRIRAEQMYLRLVEALKQRTNLGPNDFATERMDAMLNRLSAQFESMVMGAGSLLVLAILVPLFTFFLLSYRDIVHRAAVSLARPNYRPLVPPILSRMEHVMGQYALGLLLVWVGVALAFFAVLALAGVPNAPFFAIVGALLNLIPYIGILIGAALPAIYGGLMTGQPYIFVLVFLGLWGIHALEANLVTPAVVGRRVRMNPLAALVAVIIGGEVWGFAGMLLALPYTAVLGIVASYVPGLRFLAILIGERKEYTEPKQVLNDAVAEVDEAMAASANEGQSMPTDDVTTLETEVKRV